MNPILDHEKIRKPGNQENSEEQICFFSWLLGLSSRKARGSANGLRYAPLSRNRYRGKAVLIHL